MNKSKRLRTRAARHKLKAHDRGENRHSKGVSWLRKQSHSRGANPTQRRAAS